MILLYCFFLNLNLNLDLDLNLFFYPPMADMFLWHFLNWRELI